MSDPEVEQIKAGRFDDLRHREVIMIVRSDYGWDVEHWLPDGVVPTSGYDTPSEAGARALQLMKLKEPVTPQSWPEIARIGSGGGPPPSE